MGFKPSSEEQKWAKRLEIDLRTKLIESLSEEELEELRELHWKKCPKDGVDLIQFEIDDTDIVIDKCVICGGVWFDRLDLERLFQSKKSYKTVIKFLSKTLGIEIPKFEET